jgi:hypothetical protein
MRWKALPTLKSTSTSDPFPFILSLDVSVKHLVSESVSIRRRCPQWTSLLPASPSYPWSCPNYILQPRHRRPMSRMSLQQLRLSGGISICLILCCAVQPPRGGSAYDCLGGDSITLFMCAHASRSRGCVVVSVLVRMSPRVSTEHEVPVQSSSGPERPSCEVGE